MEDLAEALPWISAVIVGLIAAAFFLKKWSSRNEPPGPWGVPVLGYLPFLGRKMNQTINNLSKKHGNVFQLKMGSRKVIVFSGEKTIREAMLDCGGTFAGRPNFYSCVSNPSFSSFDFTPTYRVYRKTTMASLSEFVQSYQTDIQTIGQNAAKMFVRDAIFGQPFDPQQLILRVTCTIVGYICYGQEFDANDKTVSDILESGKKFAEYAPYWLICDYLPWAKFFFKSKLQELEKFLKALGKYAEILANQNDENCNRNKMFDIFQRKCTKMTDSEKAEHNLNDETIREQVHLLFGPGFGTSSTALRYGLMMMALYPEVQKKVHDELDEVVGRNRSPEIADKADLPYTMAVITELARHHSMTALSFTMATTRDTEFHGYSFAKGTPVLFNYYSINRSDDVFENAEKFSPERFIKEDGLFDKSLASRVINFGLGQRRCVGEQLGNMQLFLFFTNMLQLCKIEKSPEHPLDLDDYMFTFGITHGPFKVIFHKRMED